MDDYFLFISTGGRVGLSAHSAHFMFVIRCHKDNSYAVNDSAPTNTADWIMVN